MEDVPEAIFGPGDCFGDVEMVEDCPRMNTYTAMCKIESNRYGLKFNCYLFYS